jgi:hypothetical protein
MTNNNKQTEIDIAELAMKLYPFSNSERNAFINGYNKAKEMEKEWMVGFTNKYINSELWVNCNAIESDSTVEQYYNSIYGDNEQAIIDYNAMEEEWEMDNYNEMNNE